MTDNVIPFPGQEDDTDAWSQVLVDLHEQLYEALVKSASPRSRRVRLSVVELVAMMEAIEIAVGPEWFDDDEIAT